MHIPLAARILFMVVSVSARPWWLSLVPRSECTEAAEVVCSNDCSQVMVCLGVGLDGFLSVPVATCDAQSNMKCSAVNKTCIPADQSDCQRFNDNSDVGGGFRCHNVGSFPDPYDCQKFHLCLEGESSSELASCNGTSAYDPLSRECSLTTSDRVCTEGPIKPCSQLGQIGVVYENPRIYYVCLQQRSKIVPEMHLCPWGMIFDLSVASCVDTSSTTPSWVVTTTDPPRETMGTADTTEVSPWRNSNQRHSHGRHWSERRRWRSHHGRHHRVYTTAIPTSALPLVTPNEDDSTTAPPWRMWTSRMSHRRPQSERTRWWSHRGRPRWTDTTTGSTTDHPYVTTGDVLSTVVPRATLGWTDNSKVLPGLASGPVDTTTAHGATPGKVYTTAVPLWTTSDGVSHPKGIAATAMAPSWTMIGGADVAGVSPFDIPSGVDITTVPQATLGRADTSEVPPQATLVQVDMTVTPQGDDHEFPVVVDAESSRALIPRATLDLLDTAKIPLTTPEESVMIDT